MKNISQEKLLAMPIPLPSARQQRRFANRVEVIMAERAKLIESTHQLDSLFASLQHRAFSGQL